MDQDFVECDVCDGYGEVCSECGLSADYCECLEDDPDYPELVICNVCDGVGEIPADEFSNCEDGY